MEKPTQNYYPSIRTGDIQMTVRSFRNFLLEGEPNILFEDISGNQKRTKMKELERQLKSHDWYYMYSDDGRAYGKGRDSNDKIHQLVKDIGDDGKKLYKKYSKKYESVDKHDVGKVYQV